VEQCKNYITKHLNQKFTIDEIANEIAITKTYLCHLFSEQVGIGIQQYAQRKRIEAAKNMLRYSDTSILEIASYLCFNSQSHFGKVFKDQVNETPQRYREKNKFIDFKN
jgi:AraC-like DNA-binding protein